MAISKTELMSLQFRSPAVIIDRVALLTDELQLKLARPRPAADDIHKIRVCCKKLRSWVRLLRYQHGASDRQRADKALRSMAGKYAPARDGMVLQQTLAALQASARSERNRAACGQVLAGLHTLAPVATAGSVAPLSKRIVKALLASDGLTGKILHKGLQHAHARSVQLTREAFTAANSAASLHRLRRRVKYLAYQLELVAVPTPFSDKFHKQLVKLGRVLGRIHDLTVLQQQVLAVEKRYPTSVALIRVQTQRLQRRLIRQAAVLANACL